MTYVFILIHHPKPEVMSPSPSRAAAVRSTTTGGQR